MTQATVDYIKNKAIPILKQAGVTRSSLFGSYVRDEENMHSDIDILVELPQGTGLFTFVDLKRKLEKSLNKKVDLVTFRSINPLLRDTILKEQFPIL